MTTDSMVNRKTGSSLLFVFRNPMPSTRLYLRSEIDQETMMERSLDTEERRSGSTVRRKKSEISPCSVSSRYREKTGDSDPHFALLDPPCPGRSREEEIQLMARAVDGFVLSKLL